MKISNWISAGLLLILVIFIFSMLSGCSQTTAVAEPRSDINDGAAVEALNRWWKEATYAPEPIKVGTVTPAHTITSTKGRTYNIPKHVQTKHEFAQEAEDRSYMAHKQALLRGFTVKGHTVTVLTNLSTADLHDAREICHDLGGFVWANANRHFGLENITVAGARGELLSSRIGLRGKVQ